MADEEKRIFAKAEQVDAALGLVFGWAIVCKEDGERYFDVQDDHIPEDSMLEASTDFMVNSRVVKAMHDGEQVGTAVFAWPLTEDIAKAMGLTSKRTGLMLAVKPEAEVLSKFIDGTYTGFSIGGRRVKDEEAE